ncbi:CsiV family protein [Rheinheimera sp.]|uniref:CsiV family protein n=1 Tax=Rheinheimera sp. TaxID=1869214 RepID=UPI004047760F
MSKTRALCLLAGALLSTALSAQQQNDQPQRWFEVELIVFSQTPTETLREHFADSTTPIKPGRAFDLISPLYQPDISSLLSALPLCQPQSTLWLADSFSPVWMSELCIIEQQLPAWAQNNLFEPRQMLSKVPFPAKLPAELSSLGEHQDKPYLADAAALQLSDIAAKIARQSGKTLLLHTAWRQAPVTERLAIASRWFSGVNYSADYDYWGQPLAAVPDNTQPEQAFSTLTPAAATAAVNDTDSAADTMLQQIELLLQQLSANGTLPEPDSSGINANTEHDNPALSTLPADVWQLDGLFKLHLDHYLFVNTEFNLRIPQADKLQSIYVRQSRRVISGEIHYLDHPHLGIVLQIRRYELPPEPVNELEVPATELQ